MPDTADRHPKGGIFTLSHVILAKTSTEDLHHEIILVLSTCGKRPAAALRTLLAISRILHERPRNPPKGRVDDRIATTAYTRPMNHSNEQIPGRAPAALQGTGSLRALDTGSFEPVGDHIDRENAAFTEGPDASGIMTHTFFAFNTAVMLHIPQREDEALAARTTSFRPRGIDVPAAPDDALCPLGISSAFDAVRAACRTYERAFSRTLPHSDISRLNAAHGKELRISERTADVLEQSLRYCEASQGRFDVTMGAVTRLWNFHESTVPPRSAIEDALLHVDWRKIVLRKTDDMPEGVPGAHSAQLLDPQASIDLGGIAKGWIADALASMLVARGAESFVINLGGNVLAHGKKPDGSPWNVGIRDPHDPRGIKAHVRVTNASVVTSGIYERCFTSGGRLYHHILDPQTGYPVRTDVASASVVAARSIDAEGFSTTLVSLGMEQAYAFAQERDEILAAVLIDRDGRIVHVR